MEPNGKSHLNRSSAAFVTTEKATRTKILTALWLLAIICLAVVLLCQSGRTDDYLRAPIYDETADGSKQIADALAHSKKEGKFVLLQFGANWCVWCHVLFHLFETDKAVHREIESDYVLVLIDVNKGHNDQIVKKYGNPIQFGLPVLVMLDSSGKRLTTQPVSEFGDNGGGYSHEKVLAFLEKWAKTEIK
jgi:thiol:disulfide interchange protein